MIATIVLENRSHSASIAREAGQTDPEKIIVSGNNLQVEGVTQQALEDAAKKSETLYADYSLEQWRQSTASVSMADAELALYEAGLHSAMGAYIDNISDPDEKAKAQIKRKRPTLNRYHTLVQGFAQEQGLTETDLDNLFQRAHELSEE